MPRLSSSASPTSSARLKQHSLKWRESWRSLSKSLRKLLLSRGGPPPKRNAATWADQNRILPPDSAEPGPYRSSRTPYVIPFAEWFEDPKYDEFGLITGTQMGKTSIIYNIMGKTADDVRKPILYAGPSKSMIDGMIEPAVLDLISQSPSLQRKQSKAKRTRKYTKRVNGISIRLAWSGSATELASQHAWLLIADEVDKMKPIPKHGDTLTQLGQRKHTHATGKLIATSSPTEGNVTTSPHPQTGIEHWDIGDEKDIHSRIWRWWQGGTRHEFAAPCPHCQGYFVPRFSLLKWPEKCTPHRALREAFVVCPCCGQQIFDEHRLWMIENGRAISPGQWIEKGEICGEPVESRRATLWVSGLMSPFVSFGQRAAKWIRAIESGDPEEVRAVLNLEFGELYRVSGEAPDWQSVADCRREYAFDDLPAGAQILECGVDVQKTKLYWSIRAWGPKYESWGIRHGEFVGQTEHDDVWTLLGQLLTRPIGDQRIQMMLIDSGYRPGEKWRKPDNQIYKFCRQFFGLAFPSKGHDKQDRPIRWSKIDVELGGQVIKEGLSLCHVDTDFFKSWIHARVNWPDEQPGGWHIPREATDEYCQQIVSESRVLKASGRVVWVRTRANHYLDCEVLNVASAYAMNVHLLQDRDPRQKVAVQTPARGTRSSGVAI